MRQMRERGQRQGRVQPREAAVQVQRLREAVHHLGGQERAGQGTGPLPLRCGTLDASHRPRLRHRPLNGAL